jgi:hypothetical protein
MGSSQGAGILAKLKRVTLHPILFGAYPILSLLANNVGDVLVEDATRALIVSMVGVVGLLIVFRLLFRDWHRASLVTTLSVILFFSYGHMYQFLRYETILGDTFGRHRYLALIWMVIFGVGIWLIWRKIRTPEAWTEALNLIVAIALAFPIYQIARYEVRMASARPNQDDVVIMPNEGQLLEGGTLPDIYYIVLDAYAREDALRAFYLYDNSDFIQSLEDLGFYVAHRSQSNYAWTENSLGSTLNLDYLWEFSDQFVAGNQDRTVLHQLVRDNLVRRSLSDLGYMEITFKTGHYHTEFEDSDLYLTPTPDLSSELHSLWRLNKYETMLLHTTAARLLVDSANVLGFLVPEINYPYKEHRQIVLSALEKLEQIPSIEGSKFVFAHIISPHGPMIFGPNGEFVDQSAPFSFASELEALEGHEGMIGYRDQVAYINKRMEHILKMILMNSEAEPIIILQGDHGGPMGGPIPPEARMTILNAYYLPHGGSELLYDSISPVNTFRLVFNYYFDGGYELIEDKAYFSPIDDIFNFEYVPNKVFESEAD